MRTPARKAANIAEQRRRDLQAEYAGATTMRDAFSRVGVIHIELKFADGEGRPVSPQRYSLYPAARAFFRFACPCTSCDGVFDLTAAVTELAKAKAASGRAVDHVITTQSPCHGSRWRDSKTSEPCRTEASIRIAIGSGPLD